MKFTTVIKICLVLCYGLIGIQAHANAAPTRVAIIPFQINADKDYGFLQKGIVDMLASRLASPTVEVINPLTTAKVLEEVKAFKGKSRVLMAGSKLNADYAVHGSITILGGSVSIDAKMLNVTGTRPPLSFFKQTPSMDEVIPQINRLATEINTTVFGRPGANAPAPAPAPVPAPAPAQSPSGENIHAHPEKLIQNNRIITEGQGAQQGAASPLNPAFITTGGQQAGGASFWKSRNYAQLFNGLDVGDVNNDGLLETIVVTPRTAMIFQNTQNKIRMLKKIETGRYARNVGVDVADINANGTPEIFITAFNSQFNALSSKVLEYDGQTYKTIAEGKWYFRVNRHPVEGDRLLGQRQRTGGKTPFSSPVQEFTWNGSEYAAKKNILAANRANLLGMAVGDVMNDSGEAIVAFDPDDHLRIIKPNGRVEWTDADYYGGSPLYFNLPGMARGESSTPFYLPVRIRIADLNKDGNHLVIVPQNIDSAGRKLSGRRFFKKSKIAALQWNGLGLIPVWGTAKISGRIQDLAIADFDNDGADELIAAVVAAEGGLIGTDAKSALIAYDLQPAKP